MTSKSKIIGFLFSISLLIPSLIYAQSSPEQRARWMNEIRKTKLEYFAKELKLSDDQQKKFNPLYEEMETAIYKSNNEAEELMKKTAADKNATDTEYEAAALAASKAKQKEGEIKTQYFNKFADILSKKQLFQLKQAEEKFKQYLLSLRNKEE